MSKNIICGYAPISVGLLIEREEEKKLRAGKKTAKAAVIRQTKCQEQTEP